MMGRVDSHSLWITRICKQSHFCSAVLGIMKFDITLPKISKCMEFFIILDNKQMGPFSIEELKVRGLKPDTPVWAEGMKDWAKASEVPALEQAIIAGEPDGSQWQQCEYNGQQPPQWNPAQQPQQQWQQPADEQQPLDERKGNGTRGWIIAAVVAVIFAVFAITCPNSEKHEEAVKSEARAFVNESIDQVNDSENSLLGSILSLGQKYLTGKALDTFMETSFHVDNYFVCSVGRIELMGKSKTLSFGILGHVFTFSKEDLALALEKAMGANVGDTDEADRADEVAAPDKADTVVEKVEADVPNEVDSAANKLIDSVGHHIKKKVTKAATDWLKKQVDKIGDAAGN